MDLRHLRCFVVVAEEGHFGRAAARLHLTASPVSRTVAELERELGVQLLDRTYHQVSVTAAGASFLPAAHRLLHQALELEAHGRALGRLTESPVVRLGLPVMATPTFTEQVFAVLGQIDEGIVTVHKTSPELLAQLHGGDLDLAIAYRFNLGASDVGLQSILLAEHDLFLACSPTDELAGRALIGADDVRGRTVLLIDSPLQPDTTPPVEHWLRGAEAIIEPAQGTDLVRLAQAIRDGGKLIVAGTSGAQLFRQFGMSTAPIDNAPSLLQLALVWREPSELVPGVAAIVEHFRTMSARGTLRI